jgi:CTP:molybdopterin cytidylyltransferase MocA
MGCCKLLLELGGTSALAQAVARLRAAGVENVLVVTGHWRREVEAEANRLGARTVHNDRYAEGMFSSVQAGAAALPEETEAFFLLPGDTPLVKPATYRALLATFAAGRRAGTSLGFFPLVIHPLFAGKRGHPPLLAGSLRQAILARADGTLQEVLDGANAQTCSVPDASVLLDMDTPEDYRRLAAYALRESAPTDEECEALWTVADTPERVRVHCRTVAAVATRLGEALAEAGVPLDLPLLRSAALLHDVRRLETHHAEAGAAFLRAYGYDAVAALTAAHMELPDFLSPALDETHLLYLADKLVDDHRVVSLTTRIAGLERKYQGDPKALRRGRKRLERAASVARLLEATLGKSPEDLLAPLGTFENPPQEPGGA